MAELTQEQIDSLSFEAGRVFTPTTPIDERALFAGRRRQLQKVIDAINQKGQHAVIFGERGVGKTSLSNVLSSFLSQQTNILVLSPRVNCDGQDTFESVWKKVLDQITRNDAKQEAGFVKSAKTKRHAVSQELTTPTTPDSIRQMLTNLALGSLPILIIDEFDRLHQKVKAAFADTIKSLSDHAVGATVILVGVADTINDLIREHQSVERALVQIRMPRRVSTSLRQVLTEFIESFHLTSQVC